MEIQKGLSKQWTQENIIMMMTLIYATIPSLSYIFTFQDTSSSRGIPPRMSAIIMQIWELDVAAFNKIVVVQLNHVFQVVQ